MLERFVPYLNQRSKEAFQKLKQEKIWSDCQFRDPVVRVCVEGDNGFCSFQSR
jgi:hypothetical protein